MDFELKKERFVQLRAKGLSFNKIAQNIGISKPTAIKWAKELQLELTNYKMLAIEELREDSKAGALDGLESLLKIKLKLEQELSSRDFSDLSTEKMIQLSLQMHKSISEEFPTVLNYHKDYLGLQPETITVKI